MNGLLNSVSLQNQRAITEAISEQVLPLILASLRFSSGQMPQKRRNVRLRDRNTDPKYLSTVKQKQFTG